MQRWQIRNRFELLETATRRRGLRGLRGWQWAGSARLNSIIMTNWRQSNQRHQPIPFHQSFQLLESGLVSNEMKADPIKRRPLYLPLLPPPALPPSGNAGRFQNNSIKFPSHLIPSTIQYHHLINNNNNMIWIFNQKLELNYRHSCIKQYICNEPFFIRNVNEIRNL